MVEASSPFVSAAAFSRAPVGKAVASAHALFWLPQRDLLLVSVWGRLRIKDYEMFEQLAPVWLASDAPTRRSLLDLRRLTSVEDEAMARFATYVVGRRETYLRTLGRCGLVVEPPVVLTAAIVAGLPTLAGAPSPFSVYGSATEALSALDVSDADHTAQSLEHLVERAVAEGELLSALDAFLRTHLQEAPIGLAASALGMSVRTLQRRLRDFGTSYRRELEKVRVEEARRLLAETDDKIQSIAMAVGLEKAQHLALLFRRWTGQAPASWRTAWRSARNDAGSAQSGVFNTRGRPAS